MELSAATIVFGHAAGAVLLGTLYFRRYALARPPIGVFTLLDVGVVLCGIVLVPLLYLSLASWLVGGLLALGALSAIYVAGEPVLRSRGVLWMVVCGVAAAELWIATSVGPDATPFRILNNAVVVLAAVGFANLWAQSGMKARDAAVLGGALTVYDLVATSWLSLMGDLLARVAALPFAPLVAWPVESGGYLGIGLGDLLLATVFPLVMRKAYGRAAGWTSVGLSIGGMVGSFTAANLFGATVFPVMVVLGPLMVLQYVRWASLRGAERTTATYLQAEPRPVINLQDGCLR
jgi:hypothetical protein